MLDYSRALAPLAIIMMGVSGSGKSTLGRELAGAIACPYLEGDDFHASEAVTKMRAGVPLSDADRWPWLDRIGHAATTEIANHGIVVAACSALKRSYRDRLRETILAPVRFVLLDSDSKELARRLANRPGHYMPAGLLSSQIDTLEYPQPDEHVLVVDALLSPPTLRHQIIAWLTDPH